MHGTIYIMKDIIEGKLSSRFSPVFVEVVDESHGHNVPKGAQSHFKVTVVSDLFHGMSPVKRHQAVYAILAEELAASVHALALHLYAPEEWANKKASPASPQCMGGEKS
ncbi:MAG: BolA protein [Lentisphaeria bacterium]|jgi:BolA protein